MKGIPTLRLKRLKRAAAVAGIGGARGRCVASGHHLGARCGRRSRHRPRRRPLTPGHGNTSGDPDLRDHRGLPDRLPGFGHARVCRPDRGRRVRHPGQHQQQRGLAVLAAPSTTRSRSRTPSSRTSTGRPSEIVVKCTAGASGQGASEYVMDTFITVSADGTPTPTTSTAPSGPVSTTTTLTASIAGLRGPEGHPDRHGRASATATGTVDVHEQRHRDQRHPGALVPTAWPPTTAQFAAAGTESLTAVYTPTTASSFATSTAR